MRAKDALGRYGETVAVRHLQEAGFAILARNWRCRAGEIDVIARDGDVVVFCEVKTRSSKRFGLPAEAVTGEKLARLRRLAATWLSEQRADGHRHGGDVRFDVVSVLRAAAGAAEVEHVRGVG